SPLLRAPFAHGLDDRAKGTSARCQRVLHAGRDLCVDLAAHDAVTLELAELLREHLRRDAAHPPRELRVALLPRNQVIENAGFPAATDHLQRCVRGAHGLHALHGLRPYYENGKYATERCVLPLV